MKILFLTIGDETVPSSRTRVYQYLPHLKEAGIECKVLNCGSTVRNIYALTRLVISAYAYDIVFIQKVLLPITYQRILKLVNRNIVFDFDDAIYTHEAFFPDNEKKKLEVNLCRLKSILQISRMVTIENEETSAFASPYCKNILKITGPIDTDRYFPKRTALPPKTKISIGWIGSHSTTPYVEKILPCLIKLTQKHSNIELKLVGATVFDTNNAHVTFSEWKLSTEVAELADFDIGIMPLPDNEWTRGKGGYKLLQYMAMGISTVASPVGINCRLVKEGVNGFFANTADEWMDKLSRLIVDKDLREQMGNKGRIIAEQEYSFHHYAPVLIEGLSKLVSGASNGESCNGYQSLLPFCWW